MEMSILLTARCNASCSHCSTNCGPYRTESLSRDTLISLMDQAVKLSEEGTPQFYLSGGEPFLDFPLLLDLVSHAKRIGAVVTCVTNGYWATSEDKARAILQAVRDAGLTELAVSSSRFHEEFVSRRRVERVLAASRAVGLRCTVKHVSSRSDRAGRKEVAPWAKAAGAFRVQDIALLPRLRAGFSLPEAEYQRRKGIPRGPCPARLLSINEDGNAYTCCTPGGFEPLLQLGNVRDSSLEVLHERFYAGATQQVLRKHGPAYFARALRRQGLGHRLRNAYDGPCDLCTHIAGDAELSRGAAEASQRHEIRRLKQLLSGMVDKPRAGRKARAGIRGSNQGVER